MNARTMMLVRSMGSWGIGALLAPALSACGGEVMVGDASEGTVEASASCAEQEAWTRQSHDFWLATGNDFGELAGSRWQGTIEDVPTLVLELGTDQTGRLVVGTPEAAPTQWDQEYLADRTGVLAVGGTYPLHGSSFDGNELLLPVPYDVPLDAWCALQIPMKNEDERFVCNFDSAFSPDCGDTTCTLQDGRIVSHAWLNNSNACACTSTECFADFFWPKWEVGETFADLEDYYDLPVLRLTYDPETDTLKGGHFAEGSPPPAGRDGIRAKFVRAE